MNAGKVLAGVAGAGTAVLLVTSTAILLLMDWRVHDRPHNTPDTGAAWSQVNAAVETECRLTIIREVLKMQLPDAAYADPELATAIRKGYEKCLLLNKVMI